METTKPDRAECRRRWAWWRRQLRIEREHLPRYAVNGACYAECHDQIIECRKGMRRAAAARLSTAAPSVKSREKQFASSAWLGRITVEELDALAAMWRAVAGGSEGPCWVPHEQGHRLRDAGLLDRYEVYEDEGGKFYLYEVSAVGEAVAVAWEDVSAALRPNEPVERPL